MKSSKHLWIVLALAAFILAGCGGVSARKPVPAQFSFVENGSVDTAAAITFVRGDKMGVRLVDLEGRQFTAPPEGTIWEPAVLFPAGRPLYIRVYIYWNEDRYGERRRGIFKCPPLEAGRQYKLQFDGSLKGGALTLSYVTGGQKDNVVHRQEIPPAPK